ncbi:NAD(P)H-hydrate dehydratase [Brevirhabdus sp.]|uniref:NAD(P)H-hydrate dehydratase n=1 Tax=Brevirhabdus sp. TaxID=2004514 RepID=UPI004058FD91
MQEVLSAAQMRAVEQAAIARGEVSAATLMDRAGARVLEAILRRWPDWREASARAVVLCGPGNNGGDGFVVARLLHARGWAVDLYLLGAEQALRGAAGAAQRAWRDAGGAVRAAATAQTAKDLRATGAALFVDAGFGTGLSRPLPAAMAPFVRYSSDWRHRDRALRASVSVDLPSGVNSDSGHVPGGAVDATLCVAFHRAKLGHYLLGPEGKGGACHAAALEVCDIGLSGAPSDAVCLGAPVTLAPMPRGLGKAWGHKYDSGHLLVLSGGAARGGAARLAARAGLRMGAGLVTLAAPRDALAENAAQLTSVMLVACEGAAQLTEMLRDDPRLSALCLGPGLPVDGDTRALVRAALAEGRPAVLDASAISAFADCPEALFERLGEEVVLTPHQGEFARLFPDLAQAMQAVETHAPLSKPEAVRRAAARSGATILLKGPDTVIAAPDGRCALNAAVRARAAPWLATAGTGDVLAGMIAGLLARGMTGFAAAQAASRLHVDAALSFGPGLIAEDLPEEIPKVLRGLCG